MTQTATTKEQSRRLLGCGLKADTADLCYNYLPNYLPAWSLSRLLDLMPKELKGVPLTKQYDPTADGWVIEDKEAYAELYGGLNLSFAEGVWTVDYNCHGFTGRRPHSPAPVEAVTLAIELLYANGILPNKFEQ